MCLKPEEQVLGQAFLMLWRMGAILVDFVIIVTQYLTKHQRKGKAYVGSLLEREGQVTEGSVRGQLLFNQYELDLLGTASLVVS